MVMKRGRALLNLLVMGAGITVLASGAAVAETREEGEAAATATPEEAAAMPAPEEEAAVLPGPYAFVSGLDLECYATPGPPLNVAITLTHLNPVLRAAGLPAHTVVIRELQQTCVPVRKNSVSPPAAALPFLRHVDLACYRVDAAPLGNQLTLSLRHLNPVLGNLPLHYAKLLAPAQLCVPVGKNGVTPPPDVIDLVRYIDLECYRVDPTAHPAFGLALQQLNPQLTGIPTHGLALGSPGRQLCVPVRKNNQAIPPASLDLIRWLDLEKFQAAPPASIPPKSIVLHHLNPLFASLPRVTVTLQTANALMVPVAKNGQLPPP